MSYPWTVVEVRNLAFLFDHPPVGVSNFENVVKWAHGNGFLHPDRGLTVLGPSAVPGFWEALVEIRTWEVRHSSPYSLTQFDPQARHSESRPGVQPGRRFMLGKLPPTDVLVHLLQEQRKLKRKTLRREPKVEVKTVAAPVLATAEEAPAPVPEATPTPAPEVVSAPVVADGFLDMAATLIAQKLAALQPAPVPAPTLELTDAQLTVIADKVAARVLANMPAASAPTMTMLNLLGELVRKQSEMPDELLPLFQSLEESIASLKVQPAAVSEAAAPVGRPSATEVVNQLLGDLKGQQKQPERHEEDVKAHVLVVGLAPRQVSLLQQQGKLVGVSVDVIEAGSKARSGWTKMAARADRILLTELAAREIVDDLRTLYPEKLDTRRHGGHSALWNAINALAGG